MVAVETGGAASMIEMTIDSLRVGLMNPKSTQHGTPYVVLLKEKGAERYLPIFIGPAEANAIALKLRGEQVPRPLTHDLLRSVIDALGAVIDSIIVSDLRNDTFYAKVILNVNGGQMEIDSRPSDAFALALAALNQVPIYAEEVVLEKAGIALNREEGDELMMDNRQAEVEEKPNKLREGKSGKVSDEELGKLSAYREFLDSLDLEDFGKYKS
jgi:bifunctional DNase/RNase